MKTLTFITGNIDKYIWTTRYLSMPLTHKKLDLTEIQSLNPREVLEHKVKEAYALLKEPVLVEDTSLIFHELGKLPGPYIKWFLQEIGPKGLCAIVDKNRKATAVVLFGVYNGKKLSVYEGIIDGTIPKEPRGSGGFGWDSIFIPEGKTKTHAEMSDEELDEVNIRRFALEKMEKEYNE